jgi:serine/threonine protein kinase
MEPESSVPRNPRLRGLDPERLLGVLEDAARESLPQIPGWHVSGVAGEGGSGIVWRGVRLTDGLVAAIKTAAPDEPETVERIEREAGFLKELRHPNIVGLLDAGPLDDGMDEGGLYLAMEFIDGPAMVNEIPQQGLALDKAFRWFREIAGAVAHAHDAGILHRDLKPANVLIAPDGHIKVADFGLARPIHRRVQLLSLTRAGLVAGTAEYLPPEAYHRDYEPGPAADIFALGVMLHEMLTGTPPRGAWQPASSRTGVDVRIDDIIRRAIHPDPGKRWPDPKAMLTELDRVLASPPRYSGTPLVTFPVRVTDCLWTLLGLFVLTAGTSSLLSLDKAWITLPFNLIVHHERLIGAFHALFVMSILAIPLGIWQLFRLRRFHHIPLREALPSPFGLRLDHSRTAAMLVFLTQGFCLLAPVVLMAFLFSESSLKWLSPDDPPWTHGLAVTPHRNIQAISPWKFPEVGDQYWLWECDGPPGHPLANKLEHISFIPFFAPALMLVGGLLAAGALLFTALTASRLWWCRAKHCRSLMVLVPLPILLLALSANHAGAVRVARENRSALHEPWAVATYMTRHLQGFAKILLGDRRGVALFDSKVSLLPLYADTVDYRVHGMVPRQEIPRLFATGQLQAHDLSVEICDIMAWWNPEKSWFDLHVRGLQFHDALGHGIDSGVFLVRLELAGTVTRGGHTAIHRETFGSEPLWLAENRVITPTEAATWAQALQAAANAAARNPQTVAQTMEPLFHPVSVEPDAHHQPGQWYQPGSGHAGGVTAMLIGGGLTLQAADTIVQGSLPGGRSRISIPVQPGIPRTLRADLIFIAGSWRCVKLAF